MFRPRVFVVLEPRCVEHVLKTRFEAYAKVPWPHITFMNNFITILVWLITSAHHITVSSCMHTHDAQTTM